MFKTAFSLFSSRAVRLTAQTINQNVAQSLTRNIKPVSSLNFSSLIQNNRIQIKPAFIPSIDYFKNDFLHPALPSHEQIRTVIKFSWKKGKRRTERDVVKRFYRLNCGNWIRPMAGRHKKIWKKKQKRRRKHLEHLFCNRTQSTMLDKMVSEYWRRPKYYIKNPYEPYEWRENFAITRTKPWRPEGVDYE